MSANARPAPFASHAEDEQTMMLDSSALHRLEAACHAERLGNRYQLGERLGVGSRCEVRRATMMGPEGFQRKVAVKLPQAHLRGDHGLEEAIRREGRALAQIQHPGLVAVLDVARIEGTWALVTEEFKGEEVSRLLLGGPLPPRAAVEVVAAAAKVLGAVHKAGAGGSPGGLVHGDMRAENLRLSAEGEVRVLDLGTAFGLSNGRGETPDTMAPERFFGRTCAATDVWDLGLLLVELCTGRRPAREAEGRRRALAYLEAIEPELGAVAGACLTGDPALRPQAQAVGRRLDKLAQRLGGSELASWAERVVQVGEPLREPKTRTAPVPAPAPWWAQARGEDGLGEAAEPTEELPMEEEVVALEPRIELLGCVGGAREATTMSVNTVCLIEEVPEKPRETQVLGGDRAMGRAELGKPAGNGGRAGLSRFALLGAFASLCLGLLAAGGVVAGGWVAGGGESGGEVAREAQTGAP